MHVRFTKYHLSRWMLVTKVACLLFTFVRKKHDIVWFDASGVQIQSRRIRNIIVHLEEDKPSLSPAIIIRAYAITWPNNCLCNCWKVKILWENEEKNQGAAPMKMQTLKTHVRSQNNGKQDQMEKLTKNNKNQRKKSFYEIDETSYNLLTY